MFDRCAPCLFLGVVRAPRRFATAKISASVVTRWAGQQINGPHFNDPQFGESGRRPSATPFTLACGADDLKVVDGTQCQPLAHDYFHTPVAKFRDLLRRFDYGLAFAAPGSLNHFRRDATADQQILYAHGALQ